MYIDSHFHVNVYNRYPGTLETALKQLEDEEIFVIGNSIDIESFTQTKEIAVQSKMVLPCFGIHPQVAKEHVDNLEQYEEHFNEALAYGEIGLDSMHVEDEEEYPIQEKLLAYFFGKAALDKKIVFLHLDGAEEKGLEMIKVFGLKKVVVHGYVGSLETLKEMLAFGVYFSIGGNKILDEFKEQMTEKEWTHYQEIVKAIPMKRLLIETDGPCRTVPNPEPDAQRSQPDYIKKMYKKISQIKGISLDELQVMVRVNLSYLLGNDPRLKQFTNLLTKKE
ncbi:MAG: TatD family hydrolase [Candidatus Heimdallarchaeota archaeon]